MVQLTDATCIQTILEEGRVKAALKHFGDTFEGCDKAKREDWASAPMLPTHGVAAFSGFWKKMINADGVAPPAKLPRLDAAAWKEWVWGLTGVIPSYTHVSCLGAPSCKLGHTLIDLCLG